MVCKTVLCSILGINLYNIQILSSAKYSLLSDKNRIRVNILQPLRGIIFDRNGETLVNNAFTYSAVVDSEKDITDIVMIELQDICGEISNSNTILCTNLTWNEVIQLESNLKINQIVKIHQSYKRVYIYKELLSYITGYVGIPSKSDKKKNFLIGKNGLEMQFDEQLQGTPGVQKVEVNAIGKIIREISNDSGTQGNAIKTSIDLRLQKKLYEINESRRGIYIAMKVHTGEILGMYSTPGYDPNLFTNGIRTQDWQEIMSDPDKPMINRSISSLYPPGSTFKMITLLAILNSGISPTESVFCTGEHKIGTRVLHCWKKTGHGHINAYNALEHSCNIYFAVFGMKVGIAAITEIASVFGLGNKTNIELPFEVSGLIPTKDWKMQKYKKVWTFGDTVNVSIGQGYTLTTPLQLVVMTARIAIGRKITPTILCSDNSFSSIKEIKSEHLEIIRKSMFNVMKNHHWENLKIAGKTGTAQVISKRDATGKFGDHSLFLGFAPYDAPQYAVLSIVENAGWGSENALPITKQIFRYLFELNII